MIALTPDVSGVLSLFTSENLTHQEILKDSLVQVILHRLATLAWSLSFFIQNGGRRSFPEDKLISTQSDRAAREAKKVDWGRGYLKDTHVDHFNIQINHGWCKYNSTLLGETQGRGGGGGGRGVSEKVVILWNRECLRLLLINCILILTVLKDFRSRLFCVRNNRHLGD